MATKIFDGIEVSGLNNCLPEKIENYQQISLSEKLLIPASQPLIKSLIRVSCGVDICSQKVVSTPVSTSFDGKILTGWKLIVEGFISFNIEYAAEEEANTLHGLHFEIPFCSYIVLPRDFRLHSQIIVKGYIEDIKIEKLSNRKLFTNTLFFIAADICY